MLSVASRALAAKLDATIGAALTFDVAVACNKEISSMN